MGNGSDDLIQLICNAFLDPDDEAIHTEYGFLVFPQSIRIAGGTPILAKDKNFTASLENIQEKITKKTKIIFIANPNNPTGTMVCEEETRSFFKDIRSDILVVLDSAYAEYVDNKDYTDGSKFVEEFDNIIMLRTFSKLHALASLRLGWAYCPIKVANILKSIRPAFSVNALASFAGIAAVEDIKFQELSFAHNKKYKDWIFKKILDIEKDNDWAIRHLITLYKKDNNWYERYVDLTNIKNAYYTDVLFDMKKIEKKINLDLSRDQNFIEYSPEGTNYLRLISRKIKINNGALLILDYGYFAKKIKNTIQAISNHKSTNVLTNIGKSDITHNISFNLFKKIVEKLGYINSVSTNQGEFLLKMGIIERAEILSKKLTFKKKADIFFRLKRLIDKNEMGEHFKVMLIINKKNKFRLGF